MDWTNKLYFERKYGVPFSNLKVDENGMLCTEDKHISNNKGVVLNEACVT